MKRGQAALEYLVTYGWAILAILVVLGALAYFGVLSPTRYLPAKCDFGAQLSCKDFQLWVPNPGDTNQLGRIRLQLHNNFGDDIEVSRMWIEGNAQEADVIYDINGDGTFRDGGSVYSLARATPALLRRGNVSSEFRLRPLVSNGDEVPEFLEGERISVVIGVEFRRASPQGPYHNLTGIVSGTVTAES